MLQKSNSKPLLENDVFLLYIEDGAVIESKTPCLIVNKNTQEEFNNPEDTLGAWMKFINDWRKV